jgi:peptide/nickel transport system substrate-binding protein
VGVGAVASCVTGSTSSPTTRQGGTLNFAQNFEPQTLDPHIGPFIPTISILDLITETLLVVDSNYNIYPGLASSFKSIENGKTIDLVLRQGVTFTDGTPFNANAVKTNLERIIAPSTASLTGSVLLSQYSDTEIVDDHHVRVHFNTAWAPGLVALAIGWAGMLSPKAISDMGKDIGQHPVGTGPFTFGEWVRQSHITVNKRADYSGGGTPYSHSGPAYLDKVVFQFALDDATRTGLIESGQADIVYGVPFADVDRLKGEGFQITQGIAIGGPLTVFVNVKKPPTDDPAIRNAMLLGTDRKRIISAAYFGHTIAEYGILSHNTLGFDSTLESTYAYDPQKANQLLDSAGWVKGSDGIRTKNGLRAEIDHAVFFISQVVAETHQALMKDLGIQLNIKNMDVSSALSAQTTGKSHMLADVFKAAVDPHILPHAQLNTGRSRRNSCRTAWQCLSSTLLTFGT